MQQKPFFLKSGKNNLYGVLFTPTQSDSNGTRSPEQAILFCHPLFEEKKASHRVIVELARKLSNLNIASLMLDFTSCGDSEGDINDFIPTQWLQDINAGIDFLQEKLGQSNITLLGIRFGATMALQAASKNKLIQNLILIDPVINGKEYLEEILQQKYIREMMTFGEAKSDIENMTAELKISAQLDIDGVLISEDFFDAVKAIDLDEIDFPCVKNILLVQQSPKRNLLPIYGEFQKNCAAMEIKLDLGLLKCPPFWKAVDMADSATICEVIIKWKNH